MCPKARASTAVFSRLARAWWRSLFGGTAQHCSFNPSLYLLVCYHALSLARPAPRNGPGSAISLNLPAAASQPAALGRASGCGGSTMLSVIYMLLFIDMHVLLLLLALFCSWQQRSAGSCVTSGAVCRCAQLRRVLLRQARIILRA